MKEQYPIPSFLMQISLGGILCALSYLFISEGQIPAVYFPGVLLVYGPLVYVVNRLFLRQDRTVIGLVILNVILALLLISSVRLVCGWSRCGGGIPVGILTALVTLRGAQLNLKPPKLSSAILWMEISIVLLAIFIGIWATLDNSMLWSIPAAVGGCAALLAVIAHRMNQIMGAREWPLLLLIFALMGGVLWLLVAFLAAPTGQGVMALWNGLLSVLRLIGEGIHRLMLFLASFIKPEAYETLEMETDQGGGMNFGEEDGVMSSFGVILAVILAVLLAAAAIAAILVFGRQYLGRRKVGGARTRVKGEKRPSFLAALKRLIAETLAHVRFRRLLWRQRNTVTGTYYHLERICRRTPWKRGAGETPCRFLNRLQSACGENQRCADSLGQLAPLVERALYSPGCSEEVFGQSRQLRRDVRKVVHTLVPKKKPEKFERRTR